MRLLGLFAATALLLAALAFTEFSFSRSPQRTREIGIRIALGAERSAVMRLVVGQGLRLAGTGVMIGIAAAMLLGRPHRKSVVRGPPIRSPDDRGNGVCADDSGSAGELAARAARDAGGTPRSHCVVNKRA